MRDFYCFADLHVFSCSRTSASEPNGRPHLEHLCVPDGVLAMSSPRLFYCYSQGAAHITVSDRRLCSATCEYAARPNP